MYSGLSISNFVDFFFVTQKNHKTNIRKVNYYINMNSIKFITIKYALKLAILVHTLKLNMLSTS